MTQPPWSPKAKKPCRTCPFHKEARNALLFSFACVVCVASAISFALAERYSDWRHDKQCPERVLDARRYVIPASIKVL